MVDHALAPHLGRVRGQHRHHQGFGQERGHLRAVDAPAGQPLQRGGDIGPLFGGDALPILGQIGEHREEHEAAHEVDRFVQVEPFELEVDRRAVAAVAVPLDRGAANRLRRLEQRLAAIVADHVAEQRAEIADVGVVRDRGKTGHGASAALR